MKILCFIAILIMSVTPLMSQIMPQDCMCPLYYDPVCGTDGVTYSNRCFLCCAQKFNNPWLRRAHDGECGYSSCGHPSCGHWEYGTNAPGYFMY